MAAFRLFFDIVTTSQGANELACRGSWVVASLSRFLFDMFAMSVDAKEHACNESCIVLLMACVRIA